MSYSLLEAHFQKIARLNHLAAICGWDRAAMMPAGGSQARNEAMAELDVLLHQQLTAPQLDDWLAAASQQPLNNTEQTSLALMQRRIAQAKILPAALVQAKSLAGSRCEHQWRSQRSRNDWQGFRPNLERVVELSREEAQIRAAAQSLRPYDAMLELYEPGMRVAELEPLFAQVKTWLPDLIQQVQHHQAGLALIEPVGPFAIEQQKRLGVQLMQHLGFDFDHGRLDVSTHPFCGGVLTDVRITTRYDQQNLLSALFGVIHETGHARYEQGLPRHWAGLPIGEARSMGIHESQSLLFEMQLARSREFAEFLAPLIATTLGVEPQGAFNPDNLYRLNTRLKSGYIRVDADEVTYPAHIILRYELERALIEGEIEVRHIPELWDQKMQAYLGLSTQDNYRNGCMQDIHWTDGAFGYFPSYTLGAMYAAQQFAAAEAVLPALRQSISQGDFSALFEWLSQNIWQQASSVATDALMRNATGDGLNPQYFQRHLVRRYLA